MLTFDFGRSDADDVPIMERIRAGVLPSLTLTVPMFALGIGLAVIVSLFVAFFRETYIDRVGVVVSVLGMTILVAILIITSGLACYCHINRIFYLPLPLPWRCLSRNR